ncbi:MAG: ADP-ribosylation factor-like protein [Myxococcales bacterium]|nr:ADP-ribosylation factor-like protein [Myxococcales bacterium]
MNHARKEVHLKLVYYGPGLGGKTTNLEWIHRHSRPELRGKLVSLATESERTLFFDLMPVELGRFRGYQVRLHLCTVPGQIALDRTRRLVLRHVDGVVFVVDSQAGREEQNLESMRNLHENLRRQGDDPERIPLVVQYNKRDLPGALPVEQLRRVLGIAPDTPQVEASAVWGKGVFETLKLVTRACLHLLGDPSRAREGRSPSILPGRRASSFPEAPPPAARTRPPVADTKESPTVPRPGRLPRVEPEGD